MEIEDYVVIVVFKITYVIALGYQHLPFFLHSGYFAGYVDSEYVATFVPGVGNGFIAITADVVIYHSANESSLCRVEVTESRKKSMDFIFVMLLKSNDILVGFYVFINPERTLFHVLINEGTDKRIV